ncbi:MAG: hypothetical protein IH624_20255 [Phycisphaerae bacterium]|nr:hypothetical protein [Phycisphaerae bacterium]
MPTEWRESHDEIPEELVVFVFMAANENKPLFDHVFEEYIKEQETENR